MNNVYIIGSIIGIIIPIVFFITKRRDNKKKNDKETYHKYFKFNYELLFEKEKYNNKIVNSEDEIFISDTDNFNIPNILDACNKLIEFSEKGNKFNIRKVNKSLNKLIKVCYNLNKLTKSRFFDFENIDDNSGYERIYNENKDSFRLFQNDFNKFYKSIFKNY